MSGSPSFSGSKRKRDVDDGPSSAYQQRQHSEMRQDSSRLSHEYLERNGQPRPFTVSVAIPSSIIAASQTREFKTLLVGQLARIFALHKVDEVVVYSDETLDLSAESDFNPCLFIARLLQYAETPSYLRKGLFPVSCTSSQCICDCIFKKGDIHILHLNIYCLICRYIRTCDLRAC